MAKITGKRSGGGAEAGVALTRRISPTVGYNGSVTTTGRSGALRLESAFFKSHPEFAQRTKVRAHVVGPGYLLVALDQPPPDAPEVDAVDPMVGAYLAFLEKDILANPGNLRSLDVGRLSALLEGVEPLRDDEDLPADFVL